MARYILSFACFNGFLVVALGAFGAHALEAIVDDKAMGVYETGVQYHLFHTLALLGNGLLAGQYSAQKLFWIPRACLQRVLCCSPAASTCSASRA